MTRTEPVAHPGDGRRAGSSVLATLLALLALAASGFAVWTAWQANDAARDAEVQQLRVEVDSLQAQLRGLTEPFEPSAVPIPADTVARPPVSSTPR